MTTREISADMLGKSIVGRSAWTRPEPDVLYGLMRAETVSRIGRPFRESSPGGVYGTLLHGHGLASARFPLRIP